MVGSLVIPYDELPLITRVCPMSLVLQSSALVLSCGAHKQEPEYVTAAYLARECTELIVYALM